MIRRKKKKRKLKIPTFDKLKAEKDMEELWRKIIYIQDGKICQWCGSKNHINAHHIIFRSSGKIAKFAVENGICLCRSCHYKVHQLRGKESVEYGNFIQGWLKNRDLDYFQMKNSYREGKITWNKVNIEIKKKVLQEILTELEGM